MPGIDTLGALELGISFKPLGGEVPPLFCDGAVFSGRGVEVFRSS